MMMVYADMPIDHVRTYPYKTRGLDQQGKTKALFLNRTVNAEDKDSDLSNLILDETCGQLPAVDALLTQEIRNKEGRRSPTRLSARKKVSALENSGAPEMPSCRLSHVNEIR
jgi:hypothetical protein